jgi:DNA repair protein RecO (recombination protein O)
MSVLYQTTGFVLGRRDFQEVDRRYTVFTKEHGKIDFLARGGHKPLAKLTPHLESIAEVNLLLVYGRTFQTVAGVDRLRSFFRLPQHLSLLSLASAGLHLVDIGTREQEADIAVYEHIDHWLSFLDQQPELSPERAAFLLGSFTWKLMAITGYRPELNFCLSCRKLVERSTYRWHGLKGGVVCETCVQQDERAWFTARLLDDQTLKLIRFSLRESFADQLRPHLPFETLSRYHETTESFIISHFPTIPANSLRASCQVLA